MPRIKRYWVNTYDLFSREILHRSSHVDFDRDSEWVHEALCDFFISLVDNWFDQAKWNSVRFPHVTASYVFDGSDFEFRLYDNRWKDDVLMFLHVVRIIKSMIYITVSYKYKESGYVSRPLIYNIRHSDAFVRFEWSMNKKQIMLPDVFLFNNSELIETNRFLCTIREYDFNNGKRPYVVIKEDTVKYFMKDEFPEIRFKIDKKIIDDLSIHRELLSDYKYQGIVK